VLRNRIGGKGSCLSGSCQPLQAIQKRYKIMNKMIENKLVMQGKLGIWSDEEADPSLLFVQVAIEMTTLQ
jgi:hypothetical protein